MAIYLDNGKKTVKVPTLFRFVQWTTAILVLLLTGALVLAHMYSPMRWDEDFAQAGCVRKNTCFCEFVNNDSFCRQPSNAYSSLSFAFVGVWMLFKAGQRMEFDGKVNKLQLFNMFVMSAISIILGIGSYLYHATLTMFGETGDALGMHFIGTFIAVFSFARLLRAIASKIKIKMSVHGTFALIFYPLFALLIFANVMKQNWGKLSWYKLGVEIATVFIAELIISALNRTPPPKELVMAASAFAFSFIVWFLDKEHIWCDPHSVMQGHALWHLGLSISVLTLFLLYSKQKRVYILHSSSV
ncbi:hypothetical protein RCL1_006196 [Eukaryota sp. TZLM3-RCL]